MLIFGAKLYRRFSDDAVTFFAAFHLYSTSSFAIYIYRLFQFLSYESNKAVCWFHLLRVDFLLLLLLILYHIFELIFNYRKLISFYRAHFLLLCVDFRLLQVDFLLSFLISFCTELIFFCLELKCFAVALYFIAWVYCGLHQENLSCLEHNFVVTKDTSHCTWNISVSL